MPSIWILVLASLYLRDYLIASNLLLRQQSLESDY
jgi:hypothetical protein